MNFSCRVPIAWDLILLTEVNHKYITSCDSSFTLVFGKKKILLSLLQEPFHNKSTITDIVKFFNQEEL